MKKNLVRNLATVVFSAIVSTIRNTAHKASTRRQIYSNHSYTSDFNAVRDMAMLTGFPMFVYNGEVYETQNAKIGDWIATYDSFR